MDTSGKKAPEDIFDSAPVASAIVHYYRGNMARSNAWRNIVDNTTNWAVAATAAMLSFGFSGGGSRHVILFLAHFFILMFLVVEARRYSYYTLIDWRVRLIERELFANLLKGRAEAGKGPWRERLAEDLWHPHRFLSLWGALTIRLRRTYIWIFLILTLSWTARVTTYPRTVASLSQLWSQSGFAFIPGRVIWLVLTALYFVLAAALFSASRTRERLETRGFPIG